MKTHDLVSNNSIYHSKCLVFQHTFHNLIIQFLIFINNKINQINLIQISKKFAQVKQQKSNTISLKLYSFICLKLH